MKILMALLLISTLAHGQGPKKVLDWKLNSDTIEIALPLAIHYIKIGTQVYQIKEHEPTIELVPSQPWNTGQLHLPQYGNNYIPLNSNGSVPVDTAYGIWAKPGTVGSLDSLVPEIIRKHHNQINN